VRFRAPLQQQQNTTSGNIHYFRKNSSKSIFVQNLPFAADSSPKQRAY
jgi:hypothetical protein